MSHWVCQVTLIFTFPEEHLSSFALVFLRLYLVVRFVLIHSRVVRNTPLQSVGYLNQVTINASFLMKIYLVKWPRRCLFTICILAFLIGSWSLRACVYTDTGAHLPIADAMWLFIVTATTVGLYRERSLIENLAFLF